jgi:hypothetical protein
VITTFDMAPKDGMALRDEPDPDEPEPDEPEPDEPDRETSAKGTL